MCSWLCECPTSIHQWYISSQRNWWKSKKSLRSAHYRCEMQAVSALQCVVNGFFPIWAVSRASTSCLFLLQISLSWNTVHFHGWQLVTWGSYGSPSMTLGTWNGAAQMYSRGAAAVEATGSAADPSIRAAVEAVQWCAVVCSAVLFSGVQWRLEIHQYVLLSWTELQPAPGLLLQCTRGAQEGL